VIVMPALRVGMPPRAFMIVEKSLRDVSTAPGSHLVLLSADGLVGTGWREDSGTR
jgi:hypothetical protein